MSPPHQDVRINGKDPPVHTSIITPKMISSYDATYKRYQRDHSVACLFVLVVWKIREMFPVIDIRSKLTT